jgi:hypothetical protein
MRSELWPAAPPLRKASVVSLLRVTRKSGQPSLVEVDHRERLGVAGHDEARSRPGHRREMPAAVAAQQLAQAAVEAPDRGIGA